MDRTEDQIVFNEMTLVFAGKNYQVKKLSIRETRAWLRLALEKDGKVVEQTTKAKTAEKRVDILSSAGFDAIVSLVVDYCGAAIAKEQIEDGTADELESAYNQLLEASGFFDLMWGKTKRLMGKV